MLKLENVKGIKKAAGEFNDWQRGKAVIYYFPTLNEVETYVYTDQNSYDKFDIPYLEVIRKTEPDFKTSMKDVKEKVENLLNAWNDGKRVFPGYYVESLDFSDWD